MKFIIFYVRKILLLFIYISQLAKCGCVAVSSKRLPDIQHMFCVWQVKWSRENYYHNLSSPYCLRLASGDASGKIIVWDVVSGTAHCEIQEHSKPIQGKRFFRNSPTPTWPPFIVGSDWFFVHLHFVRGGHYPASTAKEELWTVVGHLFSLRCSDHYSLSPPLVHTTHPSSSFPHSPLYLARFPCQTWSGCGIRMPLAICC